MLGVGPSATAADGDEAFRRLARGAHPDAGGDPAAFARLVAARDRLRTAPAPVVVVRTPPWRRRLLVAFGLRRPARPRRVV